MIEELESEDVKEADELRSFASAARLGREGAVDRSNDPVERHIVPHWHPLTLLAEPQTCEERQGAGQLGPPVVET